MKEIWKPVKDFEEYFEISNLGNLRRIMFYQRNWQNKMIKTKTKRTIKPTSDRGYLKVNLSINGKRHLRYIHRLVAEAFIPNPRNYKEVNHKDNNPSNNKFENLEWCDRRYNLDYMIKHQEKIKERNELRLETLENIFYGIELGKIKTIDDVKTLIDKNLLDEY